MSAPAAGEAGVHAPPAGVHDAPECPSAQAAALPRAEAADGKAAHAEHDGDEHAAPPKRFSSLNINQRFLHAAHAAPKTVEKVPEHDEKSADARGSPRLVTAMPRAAAAHAPAADARAAPAPAAAPAAPRVPWGKVQPAPPVRPALSSQDFPTAAEVMEAERKAEERAAAAAAEEAARHHTAQEELERFRSSVKSEEHWDEMNEEEEDALDDVVEFGDGTQYKISEVEHEQAARKNTPPSQPAWTGGPWRGGAQASRPAAAPPARTPVAPPPARAPLHPTSHAVPPAAPVTSWGPLAQRHSTLTGKPLPKVEPPPPAKDSAELAAEQHNEMQTAAERARRRREEDERAREAERERARQKAAQIEAQLRAAEEAKRAQQERERRERDERARAVEQAKREARERERRARDEHARQRLEREAREREAREREAREREARERWARRSIETAQLHPEPAVSRTELILEDAPVWRQYRVRLCRVHHARRAPSQAAASGAHPRDAPTFQFSFDPPLDYYKVTPRTTADDVLFPPRRLRVQLPSQRLSRAVHTVPRPPVCASVDHHAPFDDTRLLRAMVGDVESDPMHALFAEDEARVQLPGAAPPRRRAPRVKLPPASSWRQRTGQLGGGVAAAAAAAAATSPPPLGSLGYPGLFQRPLAEPFAPLLDGAAQGTWGTSPLTFPLIAPAAPETLDPLKSVWTQSDAAPSQPAQPKNSLREIADDALPAPLPLSMHELRDDERAPSKLDVFASPFQPGAADAPRRDKWAFRSTLPPYYMPTYPSRRRDETDVGYALPTDYSEFLSEW